jgi:dTDP-4-dehydrorhamnose 3,5-epimerase
MILTETLLPGAFIVDVEPRTDARGRFARIFDSAEFRTLGLEPSVVEASIATNHRRGTMRGMHFQFPPSAETKYVRCTRGSLLDVIVDLRPESPTFLQHAAVELSAANGRGLYCPRRFAHGYQTLEDETEAMYLMGDTYAPADEGGLAYNDPRLDIAWPLAVTSINDRDRSWPPLAEVEPEIRRRMTIAGAPR